MRNMFEKYSLLDLKNQNSKNILDITFKELFRNIKTKLTFFSKTHIGPIFER